MWLGVRWLEGVESEFGERRECVGWSERGFRLEGCGSGMVKRRGSEAVSQYKLKDLFG